MALKYPILNGNVYSSASAEIDLRGKVYGGIVALNWSDELTIEEVYGFGPTPVGRTIGQYKATADLEMLMGDSDVFLADLGPAYGTVAFNIGCSYEEITGAGLSTVEIIGARIVKNEVSNSRGSAGITRKFTLSVIYPIKTNGLTIIDTAVNQGVAIGAQVIGLVAGLV